MLMNVTGVVRLARDVEVRYTQGGSAIANFSVVSSEKYKTQGGEQKEKTTFIDCTAFSRLGEICNQYLRKGSQIFIIGKLSLDQWEKDGQKRSKHSIVLDKMQMLGTKDDTAQPTNARTDTSQYKEQPGGYDVSVENRQGQEESKTHVNTTQPTSNIPDIDEDEIPFSQGKV